MEEQQGARLARNIEEFPPRDPETDEVIEGWLSKFVVMAEWIDKNGNRYLVKKSANGMGEAIATWDVKGLLFEGLFGAFYTMDS